MRPSEFETIVAENVKDVRVEGYLVFDSAPWGGRWLQHDLNWGPFKSARLYFFYTRAEQVRKEVTKDDQSTFVMVKMKPL